MYNQNPYDETENADLAVHVWLHVTSLLTSPEHTAVSDWGAYYCSPARRVRKLKL
jgi:hypothetical protein